MGREARSRPCDRGGSSDRLSVCFGVNLGDGVLRARYKPMAALITALFVFSAIRSAL